MNRPTIRHLLLASLALLAFAIPASAADSSSPLFGSYWSSFIEHWGNYFKKQNGVIVAALSLGAVSLFIITAQVEEVKRAVIFALRGATSWV